MRSVLCEILTNNINLLSTFCPWFVQAGHYYKGQQTYTMMVATVMDSVLPVFDMKPTVKTQSAVVNLLSRCVEIIRPQFLLTIGAVQGLYTKAIAGQYNTYPLDISSSLYQSLSQGLVLPWQHAQQQDWETRSKHHHDFTMAMCTTFLQLKAEDISSPAALEAHSDTISRTLLLLTDFTTCIKNKETKSKQILCQSLRPVIGHVIVLLPFIKSEGTLLRKLLSFTTVLCDALRVQLGSQFLQELVGLCLGLFKENISSKDCVIEPFIELLTTLIREPSPVYKTFTSDIIQITLYQIGPLLDSVPNALSSFFELLHAILMTQWRHFYPNLVGSVKQESCEHSEDFIKIFAMVGESFCKQDFNLLKQNLAALNDLNEKRKLFSKGLFKEKLREQFVTVILHLMYSGHVSLISDELIETLYQLTRDDLGFFYSSSLRSFLSLQNLKHTEQLTALQMQSYQDSPTFKIQIEAMMVELRFAQKH